MVRMLARALVVFSAKRQRLRRTSAITGCSTRPVSYTHLDVYKRQLLAYSDEVAREADHVDMLQEKAAVLAVDARKAIAGARLAYAAQLPAVEGVTLPGPDQALAIPSLLADQAESRLSAGDRLTAGRLAEDAATLATRVTELLGRISGLDQRIDEGVALYDRVEVYSEPNWRCV